MLHLAALRLDAAAIRAAACAGDDPNARDISGRTPLCCALGRIDAGEKRFRDAWSARAAALLVEAGAEAQCAWTGITRRFLDGLVALKVAA